MLHDVARFSGVLSHFLAGWSAGCFCG